MSEFFFSERGKISAQIKDERCKISGPFVFPMEINQESCRILKSHSFSYGDKSRFAIPSLEWKDTLKIQLSTQVQIYGDQSVKENLENPRSMIHFESKSMEINHRGR